MSCWREVPSFARPADGGPQLAARRRSSGKRFSTLSPSSAWARSPVRYDLAMRRVLDFGLIAGFLAVDFLFFHDILKAGEVTTIPQYMTGFLSVAVFVVCSRSLFASRG